MTQKRQSNIAQRCRVECCQSKEDGKYGFQMIWPGKWLLQTLGYDPYLGERILTEQELVIEGIDSHVLPASAVRLAD